MKSTGGEIDSYCTKCRLNLDHIIVAMVGSDIVKVKCKTCGGIHRFKDMNSLRAPAPKREGVRPRLYVSATAVWEKAMQDASGPERVYSFTEAYRAGEIVVHSSFGKGVVDKAMYKKCSVIFRDGERLLATSNL